MSKRLLDADPLTGIQTYLEVVDGKTVIETVQDIEPFIDRSKRIAEGLNKKEDWWPIGSIPDTLIMEWAKECGSRPYSKEWHTYAMKQLNLSKYRKLNPNKVRL